MDQISPVTETEMRGFFERLATTFVGLSSQSQEIDRLREVINGLNGRLNEVADANTRLRNEVNDTYEFVKTVEAERDAARRDAQERGSQLDQLQDSLNARDNRIAQLVDENQRLQDSLLVATNDTREANAHRETAVRDAEYWKNRAQTSETANTSYHERVARLEQDLASAQKERDTALAKIESARSLFC